MCLKRLTLHRQRLASPICKAYDQLVEHLCYTGAKILSKGTSGRHNDDTGTNVTWFLHFYNMILEEDFKRRDK